MVRERLCNNSCGSPLSGFLLEEWCSHIEPVTPNNTGNDPCPSACAYRSSGPRINQHSIAIASRRRRTRNGVGEYSYEGLSLCRHTFLRDHKERQVHD